MFSYLMAGAENGYDRSPRAARTRARMSKARVLPPLEFTPNNLGSDVYPS